MDTQVKDFLASRYWQEDDLLRSLCEDLERRGPAIQVAPEAGAMMAVLVRAARARRVLEVGTLFGYSGVWIARALPPDGHLDTLELSDFHADAAEEWFERAGLADRITVHRGPAIEILPRLEGPYDLAFVDADKGGYPAYAELALERLRPGGILLADNMLWGGRVADPAERGDGIEGIRALHERIAHDPALRSTVLPLGDGLSVTVKD